MAMWRLLLAVVVATLGEARVSLRSRQPNIVVVMADDLDIELGSVNFMPRLLRVMRDGGATFPNAYVSTPMCCPSRSSMLTGMYVHNHDVYTNNDNCSSPMWRQRYETRNFGTYLTNAGYRTGYFGKYLNKYEGRHIPPGWTEWAALIRNSRFYNYSINFNGRVVRHSDVYRDDYLTDLVANDSIAFLRQSKQYFPSRPVAMVLSMPAPHGPEDAAPQYQNMFLNVTTHRTPSWNFAPNPDKQWILQYTGKMAPIEKTFTDALHRKRLQTLQSVDVAIQRVYDELEHLGELANTYMIFTSDHGYHLGQYGVAKGKAMPYEPDIKVPFFMRGPGIRAGISVPDIVLNIDLAPTLLDIAGVEAPPHMDGISALKAFGGLNHLPGVKSRRRRRRRDTFLVERGKITPKKLKEREQMEAKRNDLVQVKAEKLEVECERPEYQPPCKGNQQWVCQRKRGGRMRIYKCRHRSPAAAAVVAARPPPGGATAKCVCPPAARLELGTHRVERQRQRQFLRGHVNQPQMLRGHTGWKRVGSVKPDQSADPTSDEIDDDDGGWNQVVSRPDLGLPRRRRHATVVNETEATSGDDEDNDSRQPDSESSFDDGLIRPVAPSVGTKAVAAVSGVFIEKGDVSCRVLANSSVVCVTQSEFIDWQAEKRRLDSMIDHFSAQLAKLKRMREQLHEHEPPHVIIHPAGGATVTTGGGGPAEVDVPTPATEQPAAQTTETWLERDGDAMTPSGDDDGRSGEEEDDVTDCVCDVADEDGVTGAAPGGRPVKRRRRRWDLKRQRKAERRQSRLAVWRERVRRKEERRLLRQQARREAQRRKTEVAGGRRNRGYDDAVHWRKPGGRASPSRGRKSGPRHDPLCWRDGLECTRMDNGHWRVDPRWTLGPFCFCTNSNNNTYWCLRTINATHNHLYCEFITGFISYYNLKTDPYQLRNAVHDLEYSHLQRLHSQLEQLKTCRGAEQCGAAGRPAPREKAGGRRRSASRPGAATWLSTSQRARFYNRGQHKRG